MSSENKDIYFKGKKVGDLMGATMIAVAIANTLMFFFIPYIGADLVSPHVGNIILIIAGGYILTNRKLTTMRALPYVSIGIGLYEIAGNIYPNELAMNGLLIIEVLFMTLGIILIYLGLANRFRYRYNVTRMALIALILLGISLIPCYIEYHYYVPLADIFIDNLDMLPSQILYAMFIFTVTRKGIWYPSARARVSNNLDVLTRSTFCDGREYITPEDLEKITSAEGTGWNDVNNGPIERDINITLHHPDLDREIHVEKWNDSEDLRIIVRPPGYAQLTEGFRIRSNQFIVSPERDMITFYSADGQFIRIRVSEIDEKTNVEKITRSQDRNRKI